MANITFSIDGTEPKKTEVDALVSVRVSEAIDRLDEVEARYWLGKTGGPVGLAAKHGSKFKATVKARGKERIVSGDIVEISLEHTDSGGTFVTLRGISPLHRLKRARRTMLHKKKKPEDVAKFLAGESKLSAKVESSSAAAMDIIQANQTDARFLKNLADMVNFQMRVDDDKLFFGRGDSAASGKGNVTLDIMKDGCRVNVTHSLDGIVDAVTIIGHDHTKSSPKIEGKAKATDIKKIGKGKSGVDLAKKFGSAKLVIESANVKDKSTADAWAKGELQRRAERFIRGSVRGPLVPEARTGGKLTLVNGPKPLLGTYLITEVIHTIEQSVAETEIKFCSDTLP